MRSYSASRVAELAKAAGPTLGLYKRIQSETPMYVVSLVDCYTQKGWLETQPNLPMVEGLEPLEEEYIPGPPTSITQYAAPITATDPRNRVYIQEQGIQTIDLEMAHAQRYQWALEGEAWAHYGWDAERVKNLLQDRNYGLSIDEVNLAGPPSAIKFGRLRGIKKWRTRTLPRSSSQCWNGAPSPLFPR